MMDDFVKKISDLLVEERSASEFPLCDFDRIRYEVRPCDVLLVEGRSFVSDVIRKITQSPWTHSCLYIGRIHDIDDMALRNRIQQFYDCDPGEQLIIEGMLGAGTIVSPLSRYKDSHVRICRPRGISRDDAQRVVTFCVEKLGTEYDVRQIFDLARFFFPWFAMPRHWRSSLFSHNAGSHTKTVCSTVIAEAFQSVSFPILPIVQSNEETGYELLHRNPRLVTPRDFDYSPYFEIIKYPFIQVVEQGMYRQLPWNETGLTSNSGTIFDPKKKHPNLNNTKNAPTIFADPLDTPMNSHNFYDADVLDAIAMQNHPAPVPPPAQKRT